MAKDEPNVPHGKRAIKAVSECFEKDDLFFVPPSSGTDSFLAQ
jgi:hypothetical protein